MVHIMIAGVANDPQLARAEMAGINLQRNLPDFQITVKFVANSEWKAYRAKLAKTYGWDTRLAYDATVKAPETLNQLIWYKTGSLIGNASDFADYALKCYGVADGMLNEALLNDIAAENCKEAQKMIST